MSNLASSIQAFAPIVASYWQRLTGWQRRTLLLAVGMMAIACAWTLAPRPPKYASLFSSATLNQNQLYRLDAAFAKAGLSDYRIENGQLHVPELRRAAYLSALHDSDALPEALGEEAKREIRRINLFESAEQRSKRLEDAHRREVAEIVRSVEGITEAFVQFNEVRSGRFGKQTSTASAMLVVRPTSTGKMSPPLVMTLRNIVAAARPDLAPSDVAIVDLNSGRTYAGQGGSMAATDDYLFAKQSFEQIYAAKLERHFEHLPGVRVAANIELEKVVKNGSVQPSHWVPYAVSASLSLPETYFDQISADRQSVLRQIESAAMSMLPHQPTASAPRVAVTVYDDRTSASADSNTWLAALQTPLGLGLSLCFMTLLVGLLLGIFKEARQLRDSAAQRVQPAVVSPGGTSPPLRVHERLTELVRDNPKVAADTITEWVRKAS